MIDSRDKLSHPHSRGPRIFHVQHQSARHPIERFIHYSATFLDLAIRKDQSEVPCWTS
jgi:hypothetical protein